MSYQSDRAAFIARMATLLVPEDVARLVLRHCISSSPLHSRTARRWIVLAGRMVKCPNVADTSPTYCGPCGRQVGSVEHYKVTRSSVESDQREARIRKLLSPYKRIGVIQVDGDPRGDCVKLHGLRCRDLVSCKSGACSDYIGVPTRNY